MKAAIVLALALISSSFAQTQSKCVTVAGCKTALNTAIAGKVAAEVDKTLLAAEVANLKAENAAMEKKYRDSLAILDTLATQVKGQNLNDLQKKSLSEVEAGKAFDLGVSIEKDTGILFSYASKLQQDLKSKSEAYDTLVEKYNSTLQEANNIINNQNARLARQQRVANALAVYAAMPKSQPYMLPPPIVPASSPATNINCTSNTVGSSTYTNCH